MSFNVEKNQNYLFLEISKGDIAAFTKVFNTYYSRVFSTALQYCKIRCYAEDVTQQVFITLWEQRQELKDINNPEAWLWNVAKNQTLKLLRKESTQKKYVDHLKELFKEDEETPLTQLINRQKGEIVENIILSLPKRQQQVYRMSRYEGSTYKEIGQVLDISRETVKEHISKALSNIRHKLIEHKEELLLTGVLFSALGHPA